MSLFDRAVVSRLAAGDLSRVFNGIWKDADRPPWDVRSCAVERQKIELLAPYLAPVRSVIDCACGGGDFLDLLARRGAFEHVVGFDIAEQALVRAGRTGRYAKLVNAPIAEAHRHVDRRFDLLLLGEVLMYLADYEGSLASAVSLLAPGGLAFISVAMGSSYFRRRDVEAIKGVLDRAGLEPLEERTIDYWWLGLRRRELVFERAFVQTHKAVLLYRRPR